MAFNANVKVKINITLKKKLLRPDNMQHLETIFQVPNKRGAATVQMDCANSMYIVHISICIDFLQIKQ